MQLVVGLGNPGTRYAETRHNIGFMVVDRLARQRSGSWKPDAETNSYLASIELGGKEVLLAKPQTFMNRSGSSVRLLYQRQGLEPQAMLIVLDDFLLDFGRLRYRRGGSDGGHNGMASVISSMQSELIPRLRIGIGSPPDDDDTVDYVLSPFSSDEPVQALVERCCQSVEIYLEEGIEVAMNHFNSC